MTEVLRFGLIADLQYANIDDGYNWNKTKKRYYRNAIRLLRDAMKDWKSNNISFILQLGDIIDGFCTRTEKPSVCLDLIMDVFDEESWPVLNLAGNHELYNFEKETLYKSRLFSTLPQNNKGYYTVEPHSGIKICALNTYEISTLGSIVGTPEYEEADVFLQENPNPDKTCTDGLVGVNKRLCSFNGAVSADQLEWLKGELSSAEKNKQNVIVTGHNPVYPQATEESCLCWNYSDILSVLFQYKACVVCYIGGHDHEGGYAVDESGIHHVTTPGAIEHPDTYGIGCFFKDHITIKGRGDMRIDMTCPLRFHLSS